MKMLRQGSCVNPTPDALTIVDRLAGLSKIIAPAVMEQALLDTGRAEQRACPLSHRVMLWVVVAMGVLTDLPIRQVFKHARRMQPGDKTPSRSNLCEARQRLGVTPVQRVFDRVVKPLATPQTPGTFYHGLRLMGIDGTVLDVPDTPANDAHFGRSSGGRGDSAFPQVRKVILPAARPETFAIPGARRSRPLLYGRETRVSRNRTHDADLNSLLSDAWIAAHSEHVLEYRRDAAEAAASARRDGRAIRRAKTREPALSP
jgi:hypothetical protein